MAEYDLFRETQEFDRIIMSLGQTVKRASISWRDQKYQELFQSLQKVAVNSRDVKIAGDDCVRKFRKFMEIAEGTSEI